MTTPRSITMLSLLAATTVTLVLTTPARPAAQAADTLGLPIRLTAFAVNMSNTATGANAIAQIRLTQWSSAAERERIITTMVEKGQDELLKELVKLPTKGRMNFPGWTGPDPHYARLGWDIKYAWHTADPDGGHRIVIAFDRYIGYWEARNQPRTIDYPFTLIEIHLNKDGEGQGKMAVATKISFDKKKNQVELENFSSEPVRLNNVKREKN